MATVDILIPVYTRVPVLKLTLRALWQQTIPAGWQPGVIICDDGARHVADMVADNPPPPPWKATRVIRQPHQGIASARNTALAASHADIVLFLGADIILRPLALAAHLRFHQDHRESHAAALGFVMWDPRLAPTPFMQWMTHGGTQNNFDALLGESMADPRHHFYGSHLSVKRIFLSGAAFRPGYEPYGWEDLDMGHQLYRRGLKLHVLHQAVGLHHHRYTAEGILRRQCTIGTTVSAFTAANAPPPPRPLTLTRRLKILFYRLSGLRALLRLFISLYGEKHSLPRIYQWVIAGEFWYGVMKKSIFPNASAQKTTSYPHTYPQ